MNEKFSILTPFAVLEKIFGPYMFSANSGKTLNDKADLYFHDFSLVPLMIQVRTVLTSAQLPLTDPLGELLKDDPQEDHRTRWS